LNRGLARTRSGDGSVFYLLNTSEKLKVEVIARRFMPKQSRFHSKLKEEIASLRSPRSGPFGAMTYEEYFSEVF
jgi:hypothetical protein